MTIISIITVNYNDKLGLERTIKSVQNQTASNFEHIIIDGNSTDGSLDVIKDNENSFSYWISEPDTGVYNAMNKGIKVAKGDYLLFLNSGDDFSDNDALKRVSKDLFNSDIIYCNINVIGANSQKIKKCPDQLSFEYLYNDVPPHQATFTKRNLFETIGLYDETLKIVSDWKFLILAICKYNATYKHLDDVITNFYEGGISSVQENRMLLKQERATILKEEFSLFINDLKKMIELRDTITDLRNSKKIKLLIKLGLINKF
ncbi:glycosyltransferase family 2 protein [Olleya aquimaris]|uniref:Glycosyltransferase involved in cell wall biosynthesis n=1 Tax=Olleya aquimaris TaxID=639310 RepID=A0A327RLD3_9FLAO|nr:glycosyltransferase family 2 protein [Olleya aquimaris]RAJ16978.1 glycosyltransferase involved in cell wall biosynthesis [Olleya aquimaris]